MTGAWREARYAVAWLFPLAVLAALWQSPTAALLTMLAFQLMLAAVELLPWGHVRYAPRERAFFHRFVLWLHGPLQLALLAAGVLVAVAPSTSLAGCIAAGFAVGGVTGSQGITFAHELGHSRSRGERTLAWLLMVSVLYAHFMVEHYRGHHVNAATDKDAATARRGETLWRFLPRAMAGAWRSAWALEKQWLAVRRRPWSRSPLLWATLAQATIVAGLLAAFGPRALLFWAVQAAYAVFLLETTNYIEHYGLQRRPGERFGASHAWNADAALTNSMIANLQRHSDHHLNAWKPYPALDLADGPTLPSGYVVCVYLAAVPPLWFKVIHPRLPLAAQASH